MKNRLRIAALLLMLGVPSIAPAQTDAPSGASAGTAASKGTGAGYAELTVQQVREIAAEAYLWGYPLVLIEATRRVVTNVAGAEPGLARQPMNQLLHARAFPNAASRNVVRPNFDTLYSTAWLDLGAGPLVLRLPPIDRYHVFALHDAWTEVFAAPGTRSDGGRGGVYLIADAGWQGPVPEGMQLLRSPTRLAWLIGRIQTNTAADYDNVRALQQQVTLTPLSQWGSRYTPPRISVDASVDTRTPPMLAVNALPAEAFFSQLAALLAVNSPRLNDQWVTTRFSRLGIAAGHRIDFSAWPQARRQALQQGVDDARAAVRRNLAAGQLPTGWRTFPAHIGAFGGDYLTRAAVAMFGLGALRPDEALYPVTQNDGDGRPLRGEHRYVLRMSKEQIPPVSAFWSLTLYDEQGYPVANSAQRFALGDRDALRFEADGSLILYIQHAPPGGERDSNWLPAPAQGPFTLTMRLYLPKAEAASGQWGLPGVRRVE